jgi:CHAD domain-containing protein
LKASCVDDTERAVEAVLRRLERTPDLGDWRRPLADRLATRAASLSDAVTNVGLLFDPPRLHLVRIAAKKLRYSLELAGEARLGSTRNAVTILKKSQEQLGQLHDLQVVLVYVRQAEAEADRRRQAGLCSLRDVVERQCLREHARYLRRRDHLARAREFGLELARRVRAATPSLVRSPRPPLSRGTRHD